MYKTYVLLSGGLDSSYALINYLDMYNGSEIDPDSIEVVFLKYNQKALEYELRAANNVLSFVKNKYNISIAMAEINCGDIFSWSATAPMVEECNIAKSQYFSPNEIENRNMVFSSILYSYALSQFRSNGDKNAVLTVLTGLRDTELPDSSNSFFSKVSRLCNEYKKEAEIEFNLIELYPEDIVQYMQQEHGDDFAKDLFEITHSCYEGEVSCGKCIKCRQLRDIKKKLSKTHLTDN